MKRMEIATKLIGGLLILVALIGFGISGTSSMPDNAVLFVNFETGEYISPPCFIFDQHAGSFLPTRSPALTEAFACRERDIDQLRKLLAIPPEGNA